MPVQVAPVDRVAALTALARVTPEAWGMLTSRDTWKPAPHVVAMLSAALEAIKTGGRLIVTTPPRHGKSQSLARVLAGWYLGLWPDKRVVVASHSATLATIHSRQARRDFEEYAPSVFGQSVDPKSHAVDRWQIAGRQGGYRAVGIGSSLTGEGFDLGLVDDYAADAEAALSQLQRDNVWDWWESVMSTRAEPGAAVIVFATRWHDDDLIGRLLAREPGRWRVIRFPALAEDGDPLGREPGEALWPERYDRATLERTRAERSAYWWSAMYQGRPSPEGGGIWRTEWLRRYDMAGDRYTANGASVRLGDMRRFTTVDLATSLRTSADYTVFATFGERGGRLFLLDVVRERIEGPKILTRLAETLARWGSGEAWIEDSGFQLSMIQDAVARGLPVRTWGRKLDAGLRVEGDKVALAYSATPFVEQGRVFVPRAAAWLSDFEHELATFPGAHDDMADAFAVGIRVGCVGGPRSLFVGPGDEPEAKRPTRRDDEWPDDDPRDARRGGESLGARPW